MKYIHEDDFRIRTVRQFKAAVEDALVTGCLSFDGTYSHWESQIESYIEYCGSDFFEKARPGKRAMREWFESVLLRRRSVKKWREMYADAILELKIFGYECVSKKDLSQLEFECKTENSMIDDCKRWGFKQTFWRTQMRLALVIKQAEHYAGKSALV
jgi:hypothetical protein